MLRLSKRVIERFSRNLKTNQSGVPAENRFRTIQKKTSQDGISSNLSFNTSPMTTYGYERLWFDEITTEGKFPRGSLAMEVVFEDDAGERYIWTPKWDEMQNLYATAERIEEINEGGGDELQQLKALQRFSGPTLTRLAKCIDKYTSLSGIEKTFDDGMVKADELADKEQIRHIFKDAGVAGPDYPRKFNLSQRWKFIREQLEELNQEDYQHIIDIIEVLVHRNRHVDAEERRRTIIKELYRVLIYENMEISLDGTVKVIRAESSDDDC